VTAEEIKHTEEFARTHAGWLREIAYQLALMNEPKPEAPNQSRPKLTNDLLKRK
jgi:hypothetical protein